MRQHVWPFGHCASGFGQRTSKIFWTTSTFSCLFTKKVCIFCEKKTRQINLNGLSKDSSEIRGLRSMKCSSKTLQILLYFMYKKTHVLVFFVFHFVQLYFFPYECPGLCQHRPGDSLGKK